MQFLALGIFVIALLHTFATPRVHAYAGRFREHSIRQNFFEFLGEAEVIFPFYALILLATMALMMGGDEARAYANSRSYTEPLFVFVIMTIASTKPVLTVASSIIEAVAKLLPLSRKKSYFICVFTLAPLAGSFITEPGAMTIAALLIRDHFMSNGASTKFRYALLGLLFVNVSIGGTLTTFAAPPVLMVAHAWHLTTEHMLLTFGWKAALAIFASTIIYYFMFRHELAGDDQHTVEKDHPSDEPESVWIQVWHLALLAGAVVFSHEPVFLMIVFALFLGSFSVTQEYQEKRDKKPVLNLIGPAKVATFLAGLVLLGGQQEWWLREVLAVVQGHTLYGLVTALTGITDNAALTYLGSLVEGLSERSKYFLLAGAVSGGGLTIIANAPNLAGYNTLKGSFPNGDINHLKLFMWALLPTLMAVIAFAAVTP